MLRAFARLGPALGALALGPACGPLVVLDDEGSGDESAETAEGSDETASSATTSTTSSTTSATSSTATVSTTTSTTTPETTTDGEPGYCAQVCEAPAECVPGGSNPAEWDCIDGFCEYVGTLAGCDETTCPIAAGLACGTIDDVSLCVLACSAGGNECDVFDGECTGVTDEGIPYCELDACGGAGEGEVCFFEGFGQLGICTDGACVCTEDGQCTADGFACKA
jgi:hypothetical protein